MLDWLSDVSGDVDPVVLDVLRELSLAADRRPEVGHEVLNPRGRLSGGVLEVAWPDLRIGVATSEGLNDQERTALTDGGWIVLGPEDRGSPQIDVARAALNVDHPEAVASRVPVHISGGRLYRPDLSGPAATRWRRLCRALEHDPAYLPDHIWPVLAGLSGGVDLTEEAVEDAVAIGAGLCWPPIMVPDISVKSTGSLSLRDAGRFELRVWLTAGEHPIERDGAVWTRGGRTWLFPPALRDCLDAIETGPPSSSGSDRYVWWGRQKEALQAHHAELDPFLDRVDAVVVERLKVRLVPGEGGAELKVSAPGVAEEDLTRIADSFDVRQDKQPTLSAADERGATRRVHVALDAKTRAGLHRVRQLRHRKRESDRRGVPWVDEPILSDAPETLLDPEVFDLDQFGDRVVGFGPVVYRVARSAVRSESGSLVLTPVGEVQALDWSPQEQIELGNRLIEAAKKGHAYVHFRGAWVRVPPPEVGESVKEQGERRARASADLVAEPSVLQPALNVDDTAFAPDDTGAGVVADKLGPPAGLANGVTLFPHQRRGVAWLAGHASLVPRASDHGLLADDMGLGKTLQVLSLFAHAKARARETGARCLVIAPLSLLDNWVAEAHRFFPGVLTRTTVLRAQTLTSVETLRDSDMVVCSYDTLRRQQLKLGLVQWRIMVLDECHQIRNPTAKRTHAVLAMNAEVRIGLSGTPVQNSVEDLWSQFDWLAPGLLGDLKTFRERFGDAELEHVAELRATLGPRILRRMKSEVLADRLPTKSFHRVSLDMQPDQLALYEAVLQDQQASRTRGSFGTMSRLFQICAEPTLVSADAPTGPKLEWLRGLLDGIQRKGEKAIIFAEWYALQDLLADRIERWFGVGVERINGQVEAGQRLELVDAFNRSPGFGTLLLGPKAAGVGLNITGANHVVHFSRHWNPALEEQATDRAYRIGQRREVHVYLPVVTHPRSPSIEQHLDGLLEQKREMAREILAPRGSFSVKKDLERIMRQGRVQ